MFIPFAQFLTNDYLQTKAILTCMHARIRITPAKASPHQVYKVYRRMPADEQYVYRVAGRKSYELKDHLGNVTVVVSDAKEATTGSVITGYHAYTESYTHYYLFGMVMPGRSYNSGEYRFGFNGQEKDDEVKGNGNSYDFGARLYDARLGRWWSVDKKQNLYVPISTYVFVLNNPIIFIDKDGNVVVDKDGNLIVISKDEKTGKYSYKLQEGTSKKAQEYFNQKTLPLLNSLNNSEVGRKLIAEFIEATHKILLGEDKNAKYKGGNSLVDIEDFGSKFKTDQERYGYSFTIQGGHEHIKNASEEVKEELLIGTLTVEFYHYQENTLDDHRKLSSQELNKIYSKSLNEAVRRMIQYRQEKNIPLDNSVFAPIDQFNKNYIKDHTNDVKYDADIQEIKDKIDTQPTR
ncbi:MAG: RHS repeat-associated core domain-containing protein [Chitinophagales bacterium]|nr:RHS repeat-associated core domain-containing protein [Chitinophagales bacterium]